VTGVGMVTPLASTAPLTMQSLLRGDRSGKYLKDVPFFFPGSLTEKQRDQLIHSMPCKVACPVMEESSTTKSRFAPSARELRCHRFCQSAVAEALTDGGLLKRSEDFKSVEWSHGFDHERFGVNIGMGITSLSDVAETASLLYADENKCHYSKVHPYFVPKILGNMAAGNVAIHYGLRGPIGSSVAACATGAQCIGDAARWVQDGIADFAICGGTEACISPISIAGFARMRAISTHAGDPLGASRPFDKDRSGFVMGEGCGILLLESLESATRRNAKIYAELRGYASSCDAHHISSPHPEGIGAKRCVNMALQDAFNGVDDIVYINAHATGTPMGDEIELAALTELVKTPNRQTPVTVSSTKGAIGHLLGAAGSVEAAVTVLAMSTGEAPPTANLTNVIQHDSLTVKLNRERSALQISSNSIAVSTSFGFGGVNTALVFGVPL